MWVCLYVVRSPVSVGPRYARFAIFHLVHLKRGHGKGVEMEGRSAVNQGNAGRGGGRGGERLSEDE